MIGRTRPAGTPLSPVGCLTLVLWLGACSDSVSGPQGDSCGPPPYFTALPVAVGDINLVTVVGGLGAPGHTLPTAHAGFALARAGVPVQSPGDLAVTDIRRVTYVASPTRQGERDYALFFQVCEELTGWFGHLTSLASTIPSNLEWTNCETYSTSDETVESCSVKPRDLTLPVGAAMGTGGLSAERGFLGLDFGMLDDRVENFYLSPQRHPPPTLHSVCPWEQFDAANQAALFSRLRDPARPTELPAGTPRCGTMAVDVAGTAKGVWAEVGVTGQVAGDERRYLTLADYPYRPQEMLALSLGPATLGAAVYLVPRQTSGRVNRAFEQVTSNGQIHCYTPGALNVGISWLLSVSPDNRLTIARVSHAPDASPCDADPTTWSLGPTAVVMVR
jgi:hypothetical protein